MPMRQTDGLHSNHERHVPHGRLNVAEGRLRFEPFGFREVEEFANLDVLRVTVTIGFVALPRPYRLHLCRRGSLFPPRRQSGPRQIVGSAARWAPILEH